MPSLGLDAKQPLKMDYALIRDGEDPALDHKAFRRGLGQFATGVTVVTASDATERVGMTVNSFSSLSLDPPLILWTASKTSKRIATFFSADSFVVNVLAHDQLAIAEYFARTNGKDFSGIPCEDVPDGPPLLSGVAARFECAKETEYPSGDHVILIGRVRKFWNFEKRCLIFHQGQFGHFDHLKS